MSVAARLGLAPQQRLGLHDDAGRAVAALRGAGGAEGIGPQLADVIGQALERLDASTGDPLGGLCAGDHGPAVDDDRAGAAGALRRAAVLHRSQAAGAAQQLEQRRAWLEVDLLGHAVEIEVHLSCHSCMTRGHLALAKRRPQVTA